MGGRDDGLAAKLKVEELFEALGSGWKVGLVFERQRGWSRYLP
jgi:hypothetical protein